MTAASDWQRVESALDELLALPVAERAATLGRIALNDAELHRQVESLLGHMDGDDVLLDAPAINAVASDSVESGSLQSGYRVGAYRIVALIGRGGMGEVYHAERADGQFEQAVALKLIRHDLAHDPARFQSERQMLARLEHPGIARLLDGGTADDGRQFMVMELVHGQSITDWCARHKSDLATRLRLFMEICDAVAYAHRNLIVHRDLKPANILVTDESRVKLLDFGVAKLLADPADELTQTAPLTPGYAAPEQLTRGAVTTATDVYALGMLLFELLTGEKPWRLRGLPVASVLDKVLREEAPAPSRFAAAAASPPLPPHALSGDLDAIVGKALRKEPDERYASASALAEDLQRHSSGLAVLAQPGNRWYRAKKFLLRNKFATGAAAAVLLSLLGGLAATLWEANIAREQASVAQREAARAQAVQDFLLDIFRTNSDSQPDPIKARQTTARELLDIGAKRVGERLRDTPDVQAEVSDTLADMYSQVGLDDEAADMLLLQIAALKKAYGPTDPRVASSLLNYAETIFSTNRRAQAAPALNEAKAILDAAHDDASATRGLLLVDSARYQMYESVRQMRGDADEAVRFFRARYPDQGTLVRALRLAGRARYWLGDYEGSEAAFLEAFDRLGALKTQNPGIAITLLVELPDTELKLVKVDAAERNLRLALADTRKRNGDSHVDTLHVETRLGAFLHATSRRAEGRRWLASALHKLGRAPGTDSPNVMGPVQMNYAVGLLADGRIDEARPSVLAGAEYQRQYFPRSVAAANAVRYEAAMDVALGRYDEAAKRLDEAWSIWSAVTEGAAEPVAQNAFLLEQARLFLARGDPAAAIERLARVAAPTGATPPLDVDEVAARILVSQALLKQGSVGEAQSNAAQALQAIVASPVRDYFQTLEADASLRLGQAQQRAGDAKAARSNLERAVELREASDDVSQSPWLAEAQIALSDCLIDLGQRHVAQTLERKAAAIEAVHKELGEQFKAPLRRVAARLRELNLTESRAPFLHRSGL